MIRVYRTRSVRVGTTLAALLVSGCESEPAPQRQIRAHTVDYQGVFHAQPAQLAERYCHHCHGLNLVGGELAEPSCHTCHGTHWQEIDFSVSRAPADHIHSYQGFLHRDGHRSPEGVCTQCHGDSLQGSGSAPSCLLCHEQTW